MSTRRTNQSSIGFDPEEIWRFESSFACQCSLLFVCFLFFLLLETNERKEEQTKKVIKQNEIISKRIDVITASPNWKLADFGRQKIKAKEKRRRWYHKNRPASQQGKGSKNITCCCDGEFYRSRQLEDSFATVQRDDKKKEPQEKWFRRIKEM